MNINPSYETIGSVFEKNILFEVPKYQRYYSWDDEQVEDYIKDINNIYQNTKDNNILEHFFGGIVVVKKSVSGSNRQQRELIDGQQRMTTTIFLIIGVIRKYESLINEQNRTLINSRITKIKGKYLFYDDEINRIPVVVPKLVLSNADKQYFNDLIEDRPLTEGRDSHKKINRAYRKIVSYINSIVDAIPDENDKIDALAKFDDVIHKGCTIIFIDADSRESAYKLFQVLNDRGAGLTEGDLLKSKTLEVLESHFPIKQGSMQNSWDEILQDEPKQVEAFLRYYFASVCGYRVGRTTLYDDFLKQFFPGIINKDIITDEQEAIRLVEQVDHLLFEIRNFRKITAGEWVYPLVQPITEWERRRLYVLVNYLDFDIVYPLLMSATKLNHKKFAQLVHMLEKFMFRYKSVCNLGHQKVSSIFMEEAKKIRLNPETYPLTSLRNTLRTLINEECTDEVFKIGISKLRYRTSGGNKQLRYFFSVLLDYWVWYNNGTAETPNPQTNIIINFENVSIEHITSQSPEEPHQEYPSEDIHKLKNLTVLTPNENDKVCNKPYKEKRDIYRESEYKLNKFFEFVEEWTDVSSQAWEEYLKNMACKVFIV